MKRIPFLGYRIGRCRCGGHIYADKPDGECFWEVYCANCPTSNPHGYPTLRLARKHGLAYFADMTVPRRWRRRRPHCDGWWDWKEHDRDPVPLLLCNGGQTVDSLRAFEAATGVKGERGCWHTAAAYWEQTDTEEMCLTGSLWRQRKGPPTRKEIWG